jgi:hypothetical protein
LAPIASLSLAAGCSGTAPTAIDSGIIATSEGGTTDDGSPTPDAAPVDASTDTSSGGDSSLVCPGSYSKSCTTVADCTTVAKGCYCGKQPIVGISSGAAKVANTCEQNNQSHCALGCANQAGQVAEDGKSTDDGGTIQVRCDTNICHTVVQ